MKKMSHANSVFGIEWRDSWVQKTSICQWHTIVSVRFLNIIPFMRQNDQQNHEIALSTTSSMWKKAPFLDHFPVGKPWVFRLARRQAPGVAAVSFMLNGRDLGHLSCDGWGLGIRKSSIFSWDFPWQTFRKPLLFSRGFRFDRQACWLMITGDSTLFNCRKWM